MMVDLRLLRLEIEDEHDGGDDDEERRSMVWLRALENTASRRRTFRNLNILDDNGWMVRTRRITQKECAIVVVGGGGSGGGGGSDIDAIYADYCRPDWSRYVQWSHECVSVVSDD